MLAEVVRRLVQADHPWRLYLFGSTARGDSGSDSYYDFMVVVPDDAPLKLQDGKMGYRALSGLGIAKDILVWKRSEFDKRLHLKASLPSTVVEEGKLPYAADDTRTADARERLVKTLQDLRRVEILLAAAPADV